MSVSPSPDPIPSTPSRRSLVGGIFLGVAALATGAVALAGAFLSNALRQRHGRPWVRIGKAEDLDAETFRPYVLRVPHTHAWVREQQAVTVYIKDFYPKEPLALLATCTHLGCAARWVKETSRFLCPCHGGQYDAQGAVVAGPPPRPLARCEVKIEDEICFVRLPGEETAA